MGILSFITRPQAVTEERNPGNDFWFSPLNMSASGDNIDDNFAMSISAVWAAVKVVAETLATLPIQVFSEEDSKLGKTRNRKHKLNELLNRPNQWQTWMEFCEMLTGHALLHGNGFALIQPGRNGPFSSLIPLHPTRMQVEQLANGRLRYRYQWSNGTTKIYTQDEMFHLRGFGGNGITGYSVLSLARNPFGLAKAAESYGTSQFSKRPMPAGILRTEKTLSKEAAQRVGRSFQAAHSGSHNHHGVAVLEEGLQWQEIGMNNADAEFLATRKFQVVDIARWFRVPPHMIGDLERATFSNIEQQSIDFVRHTLTPWAIRWQQAIQRDLILVNDPVFVEFNFDSLLRGDTAARYASYSVAVQNGILTRNEVRALENREPLEGLDEPLTPLNLGGDPTSTKDPGSQQESTEDAEDDSFEPNASMYAVVHEAALRFVRREAKAINRWADRLTTDLSEWADKVAELYETHAPVLAESMCLSTEKAEQICAETTALFSNIGPAKAKQLVNDPEWQEARAQDLINQLGV